MLCNIGKRHIGIDAFNITNEVVLAGNTLLLLVTAAMIVLPAVLLFLFYLACKKSSAKAKPTDIDPNSILAQE